MPNPATINSLRAEFSGDVRDADQLMAFALGKDAGWLLAHGQDSLTDEQVTNIRGLFSRRAKQEPLAYLVGSQPFYGRSFSVTSDVLIPRPESELIIDQIKKDLSSHSAPMIVDVGTGSGCLAITASLELPHACVIAIDVSASALVIAKQNAQTLGAKAVEFMQGDLLTPIMDQTNSIHAIIANLPYLPQEEIDASPTAGELAYEPQLALVAQDDGLALIKTCTQQATELLVCGGKLYLEMLPQQIPSFSVWLMMTGLPYQTELLQDMTGQNRIVVLTKTC